MRKIASPALIIAALGAVISLAYAESYENKKIFHLGSYHDDYEWTDGLKEGIDQALAGKGIIVKSFDMDTKRNPDEKSKLQAAAKAKELIDQFSPDVIISSDDNAFKYVIMPFYRDAEIPVVFCGINWDASIYEVPYSNTTGMEEIILIEPLVKTLSQYVSGDRIGLIAGDVFTAKKEIGNYKKAYDFNFIDRYVKDFKQWKEMFLEIQDEVDMLILFNNAGIDGWDETQAVAFTKEHTKIPTGSNLEHMAKYVLFSFARSPQEQGSWAAQAALRILDGEKPQDIPMAQNKQGCLFVNLSIADKLNIILSPSQLRHAKVIR